MNLILSKRNNFKIDFLFYVFLVLSILCSSCIHNYEPVIDSIIAIPNPVSAGGVVNLTCNASDEDESSMMKDESLTYNWFAAFGEISSENQDNIATWVAPDETGEYSVSCTVSDQFNGIDIFTIDVTVE